MSFDSNLSPEFLDAQYRLWQQTPEQLPYEWQLFFHGFELGQGAPAEKTLDVAAALKESSVQSLIYRYRDIGHLLACTDPLNPCPVSHPLLSLQAFKLDESDLDRTFHNRRFPSESATLREILAVLKETYCRSIGVEFMHIQNPEERRWLKERMETGRNQPAFSLDEKRAMLRNLIEAERFEAFLHRTFIGQKRFSLEGGEVIIPLLDRLVGKAAGLGMKDVIFGMAHRGRLNVQTNIFRKPLETTFAEFEDNIEFAVVGEGDVKYHKGFSTDLTLEGGKRIHLTLASNPSHLEAVDPVVEGKCRARQEAEGPEGAKQVLPLLIHGDAAFAGQGIACETLNLSQLDGYSTGGTFHLVLNNQIGFTTAPEEARSTLYATDVAKMLMVPIFHVHGEDPEAATYVAELALDYRQTFGKDVVVEVICYRRQGHNEGDEPFFTQPLMYEKIRNRPPVNVLYAEKLAEEGVSAEEVAALTAEVEQRLQAALDAGRPSSRLTGFHGKWQGIERDWNPQAVKTGIAEKPLLELTRKATTVPDDFSPHPKIAKLLERRRESVEKDSGIDWGTGEALAFASLLAEGTSIRLSGEDSQRGTFNHRHAVLIDIENGMQYVPLVTVTEQEAVFRVYNSMLSEAAVLGFEYGYSLETPHGLTIWEAQFGDFANGAQVIIDQFISSSETKWDRASGVTLFLPHGYEGQGAEHSSARIERYLQLYANHNLQVAYPTTPAQFFHLLRRQVRQSFRRPLVVFTPKSLLRLPACRSAVADFAVGGFREILPAPDNPKKAATVLLCSGKIFYDLIEERERSKRHDVAIIRLEQLAPLRTDLLEEALKPHHAAAGVAWVQEEPKNAGAWSFLRPQLAKLLGQEPRYIGRPAAASPAVGSHRLHKQEQQALLEEALGL
jgi:2-oxoglutarate dehydrogenase E1 component